MAEQTHARLDDGGTILISATEATTKSDSEALLLSADQTSWLVFDAPVSPSDGYRPLLASLGDPIWSRAGIVHVGRSMLDTLHPTALSAVMAIARRIAPQSELVLSGLESRARPVRNSLGEALADWILAEHAGAAAGVAGPLTTGELRYLIGSGARRAQSFTRCLPSTSYKRLADIGSGIGLIVWLLASRELPELAVVDLVEPALRYVRAGRALWSHQPNVMSRFYHSKADAVQIEGPYDAIMVCHMILLMSPEDRPRLFRRIADALVPGGSLLINEAVQGERPPARPDMLWSKRLSLTQLLDLLSVAGQPRVYHRSNKWSAPFDPSTIPPDDYATDTIFVVQKR